VPAGAFTKISDLTSNGKRVVLTAIEANEPILASKITGSGQRATLSATITDGLKAVTIRVNDVDGVGGFVMPGDRVDVVLTRQVDKGNATTDVVLQNVRVLAIDQTADVRASKPSIAKAVTLEVDLTEAQKISLAASVGTLSLLLRKAGEQVAEGTRRVTLDDIFKNLTPSASGEKRVTTTIAVTRASRRDEYNVPKEDMDARALAGVGSRSTPQ